MEENLTLLINNDNQKHINLPVNREQLGTFISSLLGQPQTIEREVYGTFYLDHQWLMNVFHLVDQRIKQQNHATLTNFNAVIFYENNLKRTITSLDAFEHFVETKRIKSQSVRITWSYLLNFPGKNTPEKQEISIYASEKAPAASVPEDPIRRMISSKHKVGVISYRINHTERTWGDDIETLLKNELDNILEEQSSFKTIINLALLITAILFLFSAVILPDAIENIIRADNIKSIFGDYSSLIGAPKENTLQINQKIDLILKVINPENAVGHISVIYKFSWCAFSFIIAFWCIFWTERVKPSFVILSNESKASMDREMRKQTRKLYIGVTSFIFSIMAGVIGNYIYCYISTN